MTSNMDWYNTLYLNYGHNVTFNFDYVLTWFNDNFALHEKLSCSIMCDSLRFDGLEPARLLHPWNFPGKSTGVGFHFLFQGLFPTQGWNPGLPHGGHMIFTLSHQESPQIYLTSVTTVSLIHESWTQFSHSVLSDSLRPHGLQHARLPCPSPTVTVFRL